MCIPFRKNLVDGTFRKIGYGGDGGSGSSRNLFQHIKGCTEEQKVSNRGRKPWVKSAHRVSGDVDASFKGIVTDALKGRRRLVRLTFDSEELAYTASFVGPGVVHHDGHRGAALHAHDGPQCVANATEYFQATMSGTLDGSIGQIYPVRADDVVIWAREVGKLLLRLGDVLKATIAILYERGSPLSE